MRALAEIDADIAAVKAQLEDVHGTECEVYARIVGYYRSVKNWNKGKKDEYKIRAMFDLPDNLAKYIHTDKAEDASEPSSVQDARSPSSVQSRSPSSEAYRGDRRVGEARSGVSGGFDTPLRATQPPLLLTYRLYYRKTCPNCPPVKARMQSIVGGKRIDVDTKKGLAQAAAEGVFAAPTVIFYKDGAEIGRAHNVAEIDAILAQETGGFDTPLRATQPPSNAATQPPSQTKEAA